MELKKKIESIIREAVAGPGTETRYREPLVGYASASDPIFDDMVQCQIPTRLLIPP